MNKFHQIFLKLKPAAGYMLLAFCLLLNALFLKGTYLNRFEPMDYGGSLDLAWRYIQGQKPYVDFIYNAGPIFPVTLAFFIKLFGFGKPAVLAHLLMSSSLYVFLIWLVSRRYLSWMAAVLPCLVAATFHWNYVFPNYIHDAYVWALAGLALPACRIPFKTSREAYWTFFGAAVFLVLSCFAKHNVGVPYGLILLGLAFATRERGASFSGLFLGGALAGIAVIFFLTPDHHAFFFDNIFPYVEQEKGRWRQFLSLKSVFVGFYWLLAAVSLAAVFPFRRQTAEFVVLAAGAAFASYFSYVTNTEKGIVALPLLTALLLLFQVKDELYRKSVRFKGTMALVLVLGLAQFAVSAYFAGSKQKKYRAQNTYAIKAGPLEGWMAEPQWGGPMDYFSEKINRFIPKDENLLMLDKMQIIYPLTRRESFKGVVFHFFIDAVQRSAPLRKLNYEAIVKHPPDWVLTGYQLSGLMQAPGEPGRGLPISLPYDVLVHLLKLEDFLSANYQLIDATGGYAILRKKPAVK
jgi:hypothetical protein